MTREELIKAMDDSKDVRWKNDAYKCFKDKFGRYLVKCTLNDYTIGIFHQNRMGMNIDLENCYIKKDLKFDTVCALSFTFFHDSKKPNVIKNVDKIKDAIINKVINMTDEEIIHQIDFGETINSDLI